MAGRKPARMYRRVKQQSYTRREYMGGVPNSRIAQFEMGNVNGDFPIEMQLISESVAAIRHTALEAARIACNRTIQKKAGSQGYFMKIHVYPHEVIRENKMATGAGADRISSGMRNSFGKAVGTAARVRKGQVIMTLRVGRAHFKEAKIALWKAGIRIPASFRIDVIRGEAIN
ncbi:MAG: 50S ribosomal protein L16 [Thermoplasmata archaeon]|nr:50S ribosomal protein L16 [Thermoplasmata archaeon]